MDNEICILGAGGHAKVVIEIAELSGVKISGVYDHNHNVMQILQYPVFHNLSQLANTKNVFVALGGNESRKKNAEALPKHGINLIHPTAVISRSVQLGFGNVIMAGAIVNSSTKIGNHCIINSGSCIDHDCVIENYAHISPRAALAGNVKVGEGAQIGIGASVKQNITIGNWAIVGAGAVVLKDVPDFAIVVGNPAKYLKSNILSERL